MQCVLLAAGYATRLYPLTRDLPKSLLPIGDKTILELIVQKIEQIDGVDRIVIVTNDKFFGQFDDWVAQRPTAKKFTVLNDGTTANENRMGAIADMRFAVNVGMVDDDVLVMAGDNLFDFFLTDFVDFFDRVDRDCITAHELLEPDALRRTGVIEIDDHYKVIGFEEKPQTPKSKLASPPFYIFKRSTLSLIKKYLEEGNNPDAPGNFIPWLIQYKEVCAYLFKGNRYDIGNMESYQQAVKRFSRLVNS